jgi:predicted secreted hydrolase
LAVDLAGELPPDGFSIARPGYTFAFPRDHGSHPSFRTEWWYVTGHLWSPAGRRFGFQLTFFRQGTHHSPWKGSQAWRTDQVFLAHAALTDLTGKRFLVAERFARGGIFANAKEGHLSVFHGPWALEEMTEGALSATFTVQGASLKLAFTPATDPVIFGENGVSRKGDDPSAASHYITFPRMAATGTIRLPEGLEIKVSGQGWMDHEFSSNQLSQGQVGWDWAAIQLRTGHHLMAYRLRREDGSQDPWSTLTEVDSHGKILRTTHAFEMKAAGTWVSPSSGTRYPQPVVLSAWDQHWRLMPLLPDQELRTPRSTGITYWEGACRVLDDQGLEIGDAYLEQTGYAHSLQGRF